MKRPSGWVHFLPFGAVSSTSIFELLCFVCLACGVIEKLRKVPRMRILLGCFLVVLLNPLQTHDVRGMRDAIFICS